MAEKIKIKNLKILIVGHVTESYGPMQSLPEYCRKHVEKFAVISHPFGYCGIPNAECFLYHQSKKTTDLSVDELLSQRGNSCRAGQLHRFDVKLDEKIPRALPVELHQHGEVVKKFRGPKFKSFHLIHYLTDVFLTFWFVAKMKEKWDLYIGSDCLNALAGVILRNLGIVPKVVFYEHDYSPERFANWLLDAIFHYINGFAARCADVVWDNPPGLLDMRKKQGVELEKIIRVPHGVDLSKIKIPPPGKIQRKTLVYIGYIDQAKGLQLVVRAMRKVVKVVPEAKVAIVGSGHYEAVIRKMVGRYKLDKFFIFFGFTQHDWTLSYVPTCAVGLAPYTNWSKSTFRFAEPLKVKDYLACGLPVVITRVPGIAKEIEAKHLGLAIRYNQKELEGALIRLLTDDKLYQTYRKNVLSYSSKISWENTFDQAFSRTLKIIKSSE